MEMETQKNREIPFAERSPFQKMKVIETYFDGEIRPLLHQDGGDVEILDITDEDGKTMVTISYKGACMGCGSALTGTLNFIEQGLKESVDESIRVTVS